VTPYRSFRPDSLDREPPGSDDHSPARGRPARRRFRLGAGLAAVGLAAGLSLPALPAPADALPTTLLEEASPGRYDSAPVPEGICFVTVTVAGSAGGAPYVENEGSGEPGGRGATVTARLAVQPGDVLHAVVGGAGVDAQQDDTGDGGFGGGGGAGGGIADDGYFGNGGGGGATSVGIAGDPLVVAGAGGGSGRYTTGGDAGAPGADAQPGDGINGGGPGTGTGDGGVGAGNGGGLHLGGIDGFADGGDGDGRLGGGGGGGAPLGLDGGHGGTGSGAGGDAVNALGGDGGGSGTAFGGDGGHGGSFGPTNVGGAGGAGGFGFGGGGGGTDGSAGGGAGYGAGAAGNGGGAGGGGGSSFVAESATDISSQIDRTADGEVVATYDATTDTCPPDDGQPGDPGDGGPGAGAGTPLTPGAPARAVVADPSFTG
jgi:hypothetical protein